jgi:hypothetical protein
MMKFILAAALCALSFNAFSSPIRHVLLISVDGLHALDLRRFIEGHPHSALAGLAKNGIEYTDANTPTPADSFPGLVALVTGGTPEATGIYFDVSYARSLSPPGSRCGRQGASVVFDESMDDEKGGLDPSKLPLDPKGCKPLYPHDYLRVNTAFEVVRQAGGYTAWIDKHPVYEIVEGPSGKGVDDLYTPEIGRNAEGGTHGITSKTSLTERYDEMKVDALVREMDGRTHDGGRAAPVPELFGMNIQEINVGQKIYGYADGDGKPSNGLEQVMLNLDRLIGRIAFELKRKKLYDSTLVIITAKHGNGPVDPVKLRHVDERSIIQAIGKTGASAHVTADRSALIWLEDRSRTAIVASALQKQANQLGIDRLLYGDSLSLLYPSDSRSPDIVVIPEDGVIYSKAGDKGKAEHGGFDSDDTHVALLLSNPSITREIVRAPASTASVAPTLLAALGLSPERLMAVRIEGTALLPGWDRGAHSW